MQQYSVPLNQFYPLNLANMSSLEVLAGQPVSSHCLSQDGKKTKNKQKTTDRVAPRLIALLSTIVLNVCLANKSTHTHTRQTNASSASSSSFSFLLILFFIFLIFSLVFYFPSLFTSHICGLNLALFTLRGRRFIQKRILRSFSRLSSLVSERGIRVDTIRFSN